MKDTVVINVGAVEACAVARPWKVRVCSGTVYFPAQGTLFRAESSTGPEKVDRILGQIRLVSDKVGVPAFQPLAVNAQGRSGEKYAARLTDQGFDVEVQTRRISAGKPGYVLGASPAPGTMLPPGSTVTITVIAEPAGPADEVSVGIGTDSNIDREQFATDEQIRAGDTTLHLQVGERIWALRSGYAPTPLPESYEARRWRSTTGQRVPTTPMPGWPRHRAHDHRAQHRGRR